MATPTGQVLRWQTRIITQPIAISGAVEKPNSSAPSSAATTTSRPVFIWPSTSTRIRLRRSLSSSVCWVSASPISHGMPAPWIEDCGEAPVPPSWPEIVTWSAFAFATPAATVPTPTSETSLTDTERGRVGAAQVVDQLLEILDRVDVVVGRRRDQPDAGGRVADPRDVVVDLVAGQLPALAGLGALGHLDLELVGVDEVVDRHAEAPGGDLLDRRAPQVAVRVGRCSARRPRRPRRCSTCAPRRFIAIASVSWASRDERAEAHRAGREALDDLGRRLDLVERDRLRQPCAASSGPRSAACAVASSLARRAYSS